MPNKILESLTIGGTTFDMHSPKRTSSSTETAKVPTAHTWVKLLTHTIEEAGVYIVCGNVYFGVASSTGATARALRILIDGTERLIQTAYDGNNAGLARSGTNCIIIDSVPATLVLQVHCTKTITNNCTAIIEATKIIDLPSA